MLLRLAAPAALSVLALAAAAGASAAGSTERSRAAAYLEEAFAHDLCTRDDRALRALNRALAHRPSAKSPHR